MGLHNFKVGVLLKGVQNLISKLPNPKDFCF